MQDYSLVSPPQSKKGHCFSLFSFIFQLIILLGLVCVFFFIKRNYDAISGISVVPSALPADPLTGFVTINSLTQVPDGEVYDTSTPIGYDLANFSVGILLSHGFEHVEGLAPAEFFHKSGANVTYVTPDWLVGQNVIGSDWIKPYFLVPAQMGCTDAKSAGFDAILVAGGAPAADVLRNEAACIDLIKAQFNSSRIISTTCASSGTLIEAGIAKDGRRIAGSPHIYTDITNAGAVWTECPTATWQTVTGCTAPGTIRDEANTNLITNTDPHDNYLYYWMKVVADALLE